MTNKKTLRGSINSKGGSHWLVASMLSVVFLTSGFFIFTPVLADHATTVSVSPEEVQGNSIDTYDFTIDNDGPDSVYLIKITAPTGFTITGDVSCPEDISEEYDWSSSYTDDYAICQTGGHPSNENLISGSATISFSAVSANPEDDTVYNWGIYTEDNQWGGWNNPDAQVLVDVHFPITTDNAPASDEWQTSPFDITLTCDDDRTEGVTGSGCENTYYSVNEGEYIIGTSISVDDEGITNISYYSEDVVGNTEDVHNISVKLDTVAPVTSDSVDQEWYNESVEVTLSSFEETSGLAAIYYTTNGDTPTTTDEYSGPFTLSAEGEHPLQYFSVDAAGNVENVVPGSIVKIDRTDPVAGIEGEPENWTNSSQTASVTCSDEGSEIINSGCNTESFGYLVYDSEQEVCSIDPEDYTSGSSVGITSHSWVCSYVKDNAGNEDFSNPVEFKVDQINPETTLSDDQEDEINALAEWQKTDAEITLTYEDNGGSGVNQKFLDIVPFGETCEAVTPYDDSVKTVSEHSTVCWTVNDNAGNSTSGSADVKVDKTSPTIEINSPEAGAWYNNDFDVDVSDNDEGGSNVAFCEYQVKSAGSITQTWTPRNCNQPITLTVGSDQNCRDEGENACKVLLRNTDGADNESAVSERTFSIDWTEPTGEITSPIEDEVIIDSSVELDFTSNDATSPYTCYYELNGNGENEIAGCSSLIVNGLSEGRNTLSLIIRDAAGNVHIDEISFVSNNDGTLTVGAEGTGADFITIQEAINKATAGDTITVEAGTYNESVLIDKSLTLQGNSVTEIQGDDSTNNFVVKITANDVLINNIEVNGTGSAVGDNNFDYGILVENTDGVEIKNSTIKNIWETSSNGIGIEGSTNSNIHHNNISSFHKRGIRYINSDGEFYYNEVIGDNVNGNDRVQNLVNLWGGSNVEIYENTLYNALSTTDNPTWDSPGIFISSYGGDGDSYANIYDNEIYDCDTGIVVGSYYAGTDNSDADIAGNNFHDLKWAINFEKETASASITDKNIFSNVEKAINAEDGDGLITCPSVDAAENYWGTAEKSSIDALVCENVTFEPYYVNSEMTILSDEAPSQVYVDSSYSDGDSDSHIFGYDAFATIQEGVDAVGTDGTVNVVAGTYAERLSISKPINLIGPQSLVNPVDGGLRTDSSVEAIITEEGLSDPNPNVLIEIANGANGVSIKGFTLVGHPTFNNAETSVIRVGGSSGSADNVTVENNIISGFYGIVFKGGNTMIVNQNKFSINKNGFSGTNGGNDVTITGNSIVPAENITDDPSGVYITSCNNCVISENNINGLVDSNAGYGEGIMGSDNTNLTIADNIINGMGLFGIGLWGSTDTVTIQGNTIENNGLNHPRDDACGISFKGVNVDILDNTIINNYDGIQIDEATTAEVSIFDNKIHSNTSLELYVIDSAETVDATNNWWGSAAPDFATIVSGDADYDCWYLDSDMTKDSCEVGLDKVYIHTDTSSCNVDNDEYAGFNCFDTIQEGIDAVNEDGIVDVAAGIYDPEDMGGPDWNRVMINNPLTLQGAGSDATILDENHTAGVHTTALWIDAANVNITGLTVKNSDFGIRIKGVDNIPSDLFFDDVIVEGNDGSGFVFDGDESISGVTLIDCQANNNGDRGIYFAPSVDVNSVTLTNTSANNNRIMGFNTQGTMENLIITGGEFNNNVGGSPLGTSEGPYYGFGISLENVIHADISEITALNNGTNGPAEGGAGIVVKKDSSDITITDATLTGNKIGLWLEPKWLAEDPTPADTTIIESTIVGNDFGVKNDISDITVIGEFNWWGSNKGPYHSDDNLGGLGDEVSDNVDFRPWCTAADCTVQDSDTPNVNSQTPPNGSVGVNLDSTVSVEFDEEVQCGAGSDWSSCFSLDSVAGTFNFADNTLTFTPNSNLGFNTEYTVTLSDVIDLAGNQLAENSWSFITLTNYSIELEGGKMNLISIPTVPSQGTDISDVLGDAEADINTVWQYDVENDEWKVYHAGSSGTSNLTTMEPGYGYWVDVVADTVIEGQGSLYSSQGTPSASMPSINLLSGWNLIGYFQRAGDTESSISNALYTIGDNYSSSNLITYDPYDPNDGYSISRLLSPDSIISSGSAFWAFLTEDSPYAPGNRHSSED